MKGRRMRDVETPAAAKSCGEICMNGPDIKYAKDNSS